MKKTTKLLCLALAASALLTGCASKEVVTINDKQYIKNGDSYTQVESNKKTFGVGEHYLYYNEDIKVPYIGNNEYDPNEDGWGVVTMNIPTIPEGYKYVDTVVFDFNLYGSTSNVIHIFVNEVPVEASMTYSTIKNEFGYFEPGIPVQELTLEQ